MNCHMLQGGEIQAIVGDASRDGLGGRQYCGLWSLTSRHRVFNAFGNSYAGLLPGEIRGKAPVLSLPDEHTAVLSRQADERYPSDCRATYRLTPPHYIDHTLTLRDGSDLSVKASPRPYREASWCCYINSPEDPRIHFRSRGAPGGWFRYVSPEHGVGSNIAPSYVGDEALEALPPQNAQRRPFHVDRIAQRFDEPFYYGRVGDMVLLLIFDTPRWLRFYCSPSGGGPSLLPGRTCPAWDFLWAIPPESYRVGQEYTFRVRLVYKPFVSDDDLLAEVEHAQGELGFARR